MVQSKLKKAGALVLASALVLGSVPAQPLFVKAAEGNLALSATATASSVEDNAATLVAAKANDGSDSSRWACNVGDSPAWLQLAWSETQTMQNFSIHWERRNATEYSIEVSNDGSSWTAVKNMSGKPAANLETITLDSAVTGKYVRLNITGYEAASADTSETSWNNVSIYEFEVYEGEIPDDRTEMEKIADEITAPTIAADGKSITMPEVPEGITVKFCADYEQVIGEDGTIYAPIETKTVKGIYEISDGEETVKTSEYTIVVPGIYSASESVNAKPEVIPELQEWYGGEGQFVITKDSKIVYDEGLAETAALFAEDYKEITGNDIEAVPGTLLDAKTGDFYMTLNTDDAGLGKEGYLLRVGNIAVIEAAQTTGAYWGVVSYLQILKQTGGTIAKGIARDYPKYEVRGFMLDVGRKPFEFDTVKQFAKNMAWYKMNSFHLHLSDNLIFLEDYATIEEAIENAYSGFRLESSLSNDEGVNLASEDMAYSKAEFREFIQDSRVMGVNIVPEFDMPAHALAITRVFDEYMMKRSGGSHAYLIEELDLSNPGATEMAKRIWNDYFEGDDPVFDKETTVHIGTDEFHGMDGQAGREAFRAFSDAMIKFVQGTGRTVRMWGSLSNKSGTTPVASDGVQLNIWNTGYANPKDMYDLGYDLINTLEGPNYIVPAAGYYNDYINAKSIYNSWQPNVIGNLSASAGDDQILGGSYAMWQDSVDTRGNGISEYDCFDRFFQPLPAYSARLWGEAEDRTYAELTAVVEKTGTAPNTNMYYEVESVTNTVLDYTFDETLTDDSSANEYDATEQKNVTQVTTDSGKALKLAGGESYITTPVNKIGPNNSLTIKVKMDADAEGEQILCESWDEFGTYGTYAVKAVQKETGNVGFSREGYDFSFDYTLPADVWVELTINGYKDTAELYVNGELVDTLTTDKIAANRSPYWVNTLIMPVGRIGSTTNSFKGEIEYVTAEITKTYENNLGQIDQSELTAAACSEASGEGPVGNAIDGDDSTYWHQNWASDTSVSKENPHWIELTLAEAKTIDRLTYLPRQDSTNGRIYEYAIDITKADGTVLTDVVRGTWASDASVKTATFDAVEAKKVKLKIYNAGADGSGVHATIAELNLYEVVTISKADITDKLAELESLNSKDYTVMSWKEFQKVCDVVRSTVENENSTQADLQIAYVQILDAQSVLTANPEDVAVDTTELQALVDQLESQEYMYTGDSLAAIEAQYAEAKAALQNPIGSAQVSKATASLTNAMGTLVKDIAKEQMNTEIGAIEKEVTDLSGYTAESAAAYEAALKAAKDVLTDRNATEDQITKALANLKSAKAGLTVKEVPVTPVTKVPAVGTVTSVGTLEYKVTKSDAVNGTVAVSKLLKSKKKVVIPDTVVIDGYTFKVTSIAKNVFQKNKKLKTVVIGSNVTNIGQKTFFKCAKLKTIQFKNVAAAKIGKQAFKGTAVKAKVIVSKKMKAKALKNLKKNMKKAGISKKASYKKK